MSAVKGEGLRRFPVKPDCNSIPSSPQGQRGGDRDDDAARRHVEDERTPPMRRVQLRRIKND
jgi:hypothetical protein